MQLILLTPSAVLQVGIETMALSSFAVKILVVGFAIAGAAEPRLAASAQAAPQLRSPNASAALAAAPSLLPGEDLVASSSGEARTACLAPGAHCKLFGDLCCPPYKCDSIVGNFYWCM